MEAQTTEVTRHARTLILPVFMLTETCDAQAEGALPIALPQSGSERTYYERDRALESGGRVDDKPSWQRTKFNYYPVVLQADGVPWTEANLFILARLTDDYDFSITRYHDIAYDLATFRRFLDEESVDWAYFPSSRLSRVTYRFRSYLKRLVTVSRLETSSANRTMGTVIAFYRWAISESLILPTNSPWEEQEKIISHTDSIGYPTTKKVVSTDLKIKVPKQKDPYDEDIQDGESLRPLPKFEQDWLLEALYALKNIEMILIHLLALCTGARMQTILTMTVAHILAAKMSLEGMQPSSEIRMPVGFGTGIDAKFDKQMTIHIPVWLFEMLKTYASSQRALTRRIKNKNGDVSSQYLFLTKSGNPYYKNKNDIRVFDKNNKSRSVEKGGPIRKYIGDYVIPYIQKKYDKNFHYKFHDLRATFGMNLTDSQLVLVEKGTRTLSQVREYVKVRMGHESAATTDLYLQYRGNLEHIRAVNDEHDNHVQSLVNKYA